MGPPTEKTMPITTRSKPDGLHGDPDNRPGR